MCTDANNNLTEVTDANGHPTRYGYDDRNRLAEVVDALGHHSSRTYDAVGNLLTLIDANGHTTSYAYDELNRRIRETNAVGAVMGLRYDASGGCAGCLGPRSGSSLITQRIDPNGKITYLKYDSLNRLVRQVQKEGDTADVVDPSDAVTTFAHDANGNRLSITEPHGNRTTYQVRQPQSCDDHDQRCRRCHAYRVRSGWQHGIGYHAQHQCHELHV